MDGEGRKDEAKWVVHKTAPDGEKTTIGLMSEKIDAEMLAAALQSCEEVALIRALTKNPGARREDFASYSFEAVSTGTKE